MGTSALIFLYGIVAGELKESQGLAHVTELAGSVYMCGCIVQVLCCHGFSNLTEAENGKGREEWDVGRQLATLEGRREETTSPQLWRKMKLLLSFLSRRRTG